MLKVGDKVVCPMHGAGTISDIIEDEIVGESIKCYRIVLPYNDLIIQLPVTENEDLGIRHIISPDEIKKVFAVLKDPSDEMCSNWNRRFRENTEKLQTGDIYIVATVVRDLVRNNRIKKLSIGESKLLANAKQILESELILAGGYTLEEADELVESCI